MTDQDKSAPQMTMEEMAKEYLEAMAVFPKTFNDSIQPLLAKAGLKDTLANRITVVVMVVGKMISAELAKKANDAESNETESPAETALKTETIQIALVSKNNNEQTIEGVQIQSQAGVAIKLFYMDGRWFLRQKNESEKPMTFVEFNAFIERMCERTNGEEVPVLVAVAHALFNLLDVGGTNNIATVSSIIEDSTDFLKWLAENPDSACRKC